MKKLEELGASPAPWSLMDDMTTVVCDIDDGVVGEVAVCDGGDADESNARLIAAAPELYQALYNIVQAFGKLTCQPHKELCDSAKSAIAKAAGEEVAK